MTGLGNHILLDLYGCEPDRLDDIEFLRQMSRDGVRRSGATIMGEHFKKFDPQGVSGVIIIAESHLSLHSWPEFAYIAMDYFTCGDRIDIDIAIDHFLEALSPNRVVKSVHARGQELNGGDWAIYPHNGVERPTKWFTEYHWEGEKCDDLVLGYKYAVDREIVRTRSKHQDILVMENPIFGRMLFLDGLVMTTEKDEFVYHEMLSHVPLILHGLPERVLIVGGGDGGLLREVFRHQTVRWVDLVDIDQKVVEVSREHLPAIGCAFDDRRAHLHFKDGAAFIRGMEAQYDVILVDSTDPVGPGKVLFQPSFYENCKRALKKDGLFAAQALSAWIQEKEQVVIFSNLRKIWDSVIPYMATIPSYPGGLWTFAIGADRNLSPTTFDSAYSDYISRECRYYNTQIQQGAFCLPTFLKERLRKEPTRRH
jgi:spermidine synthase